MSSRRSDSESEETLFLPKVEEEINTEGYRIRKKRWTLRERALSLQNLPYVGILVNLVWTVVNLRYMASSSRCREAPTIYEPFDIPLEYRTETWDLPIGMKTPFTSFDVQEADAAWRNIEVSNDLGVMNLSPNMFSVNDQQPTIEFNDHSGYLFVGDVFHQLHCINYLRKKTILYNHLYPYEENDPEVPAAFHLPHCIDSIRLSLQCHADLSLIPSRWADGWSEQWPDFSNKHQCRNFDRIRDWALEHQANFIGGHLVHPELGPVGRSPLNLSALPVWDEEYDHSVVPGKLPVCHSQ